MDNLPETLVQHDGEMYLLVYFISEDEAWNYHIRLFKELDWRVEESVIGKHLVKIPRLIRWYGDPWADYIYMGITRQPQSWLPVLKELKVRIEEQTGKSFNGLLANQYRNEHDFLNWRSDDEPGLGTEPVIATLNFGEKRLLKARNKNTAATIEVPLTNGSLLVMAGKFQQYWRHCVTKPIIHKNNHINLSFRKIVSV
jgi:alkylated DNA repair dioxygenase AlkB